MLWRLYCWLMVIVSGGAVGFLLAGCVVSIFPLREVAAGWVAVAAMVACILAVGMQVQSRRVGRGR